MNDGITRKRFINPRKGMRLDTFLQSKLRDCSRSFLQFLIKKGNVAVNGGIKKKNYILRGDEDISVDLIADPASYIKAEEAPFEVIREEKDFLIISKPAGVVTHPSGRLSSGSLLQGLLYRYPELGEWKGLGKPGLVHRLDKGTSGIMIVARNARAQKIIMRQFADRKVAKHYIAVCGGKVSESRFIEAPIKRNEFHRTSFSVEPGGKSAKTYIRPVKIFGDKTLLLVKIFTGRTHQIRVHLSHIGYPVAGDIKYGGGEAPRIMLHAYSIAFNHPVTGKRIYFRTGFPEDIGKFLRRPAAAAKIPLCPPLLKGDV